MSELTKEEFIKGDCLICLKLWFDRYVGDRPRPAMSRMFEQINSIIEQHFESIHTTFGNGTKVQTHGGEDEKE